MKRVYDWECIEMIQLITKDIARGKRVQKERLRYFRVITLSLLFVFGWVLVYAGSSQDLIDAARNGNIAKVNTLLAEGADVNTKTDKGVTALMVASANGHSDVVKILKEAGAKE